jgi:hypothetical protein
MGAALRLAAEVLQRAEQRAEHALPLDAEERQEGLPEASTVGPAVALREAVPPTQTHRPMPQPQGVAL